MNLPSIKKHGPDLLLIIALVIFVAFGVVMVYSVSIFSFISSIKQLDISSDLTNRIALKHLYLAILGIIVAMVVMNIRYTIWKKLSLFMYLLGILLMALLFTSLGLNLNGARGWLNFGAHIPSIEPIEFVKLASILYLARWMEPKLDDLKTLEGGFIPFSIIAGIILLFLAAQPDFGGILVVIPTLVIMFFIGGGNMKHLLMSFLIGILILVFAALSFKHVQDRFKDFMDPAVDPSNKNVGWQIQQSLIAIGSGGLGGRGINNSIQKWGYLPEVENDTIFSAVAEETGFRGTVTVLLLYLFIAWRGFTIARNAPDKFAKYTAAGITFWIVWQAFVNISVATKIFPLTGITLPFISMGGSSLVMNLAAMGILLNISCYTTIPHAYFVYRRRVGRPHSSQHSALPEA